jgi:hypothetical protein
MGGMPAPHSSRCKLAQTCGDGMFGFLLCCGEVCSPLSVIEDSSTTCIGQKVLLGVGGGGEGRG